MLITWFYCFALTVFTGTLTVDGLGFNILPASGAVGLIKESLLGIKSVKRGCPLCDSSVYSYCDEKLLHDACCCNDPYYTNLPYECHYADCSFLHANTCREHNLITSCCCDGLRSNNVRRIFYKK